MSDSQLAQSRRAVERAVYSPRFENGKPVATEGVQFTSKWYEQRQGREPSTTRLKAAGAAEVASSALAPPASASEAAVLALP